MTEPTDDDLDAVIAEYRTRIYPQDMHPRFERAIMRAAIAKWGTPPAVAGWLEVTEAECEAAVLELEIEDLSTPQQPTQTQAVNQADRPFIVRLAEDFAEECVTAGYVTTKAASYGRLMDEALSTQAQAGAVPLTAHQIHEAIKAFKESENLMGVNHIHVARAIERAHGIKGGQHGAE